MGGMFQAKHKSAIIIIIIDGCVLGGEAYTTHTHIKFYQIPSRPGFLMAKVVIEQR